MKALTNVRQFILINGRTAEEKQEEEEDEMQEEEKEEEETD